MTSKTEFVALNSHFYAAVPVSSLRDFIIFSFEYLDLSLIKGFNIGQEKKKIKIKFIHKPLNHFTSYIKNKLQKDDLFEKYLPIPS